MDIGEPGLVVGTNLNSEKNNPDLYLFQSNLFLNAQINKYIIAKPGRA